MLDPAVSLAIDRAQSALVSSPIYDLRRLRVEQTDAGVIISGRVSSYYHKQLAQEVVRTVAQNLVVENRIDVDS
jgi:osmotically-inducible protein OsmY